MTALPKQRSDEWREMRRNLITSTDIPVILGLSPYRSEAALAREKLGEAEPVEETLPMAIGTALEPVIAREYERKKGVGLTRYSSIVMHPTIEWAAASPDWRRKGDRYLVEGKYSTSRRWDGGTPQDVEAQVRWALGCTGFPVGDVAHLDGRELHISEPIEHNQRIFDGLVEIAEDFRRRLREGGPFEENAASVKAAYPIDDGTEIAADEALDEAVLQLLKLRNNRDEFERQIETLETAIKTRMGPATRLTGTGWHISWKRTRDSEQIDWKSIADGLLRQLPDEQRDALVGIHTTVREGFRPFRVTVGKESK